MDPVTHAASGAVAMLCFANRPKTLWAVPLAAIACASPDIDLAFIHTPLQFLLLHRGITHSFAFAPFFAFFLALCSWTLWRKATPAHWKFRYVWLLCIGMILLHIWLDVMTTYGTMVFLPFSHYRVRLNSLSMIDLFVILPMLWALFRWRKPTVSLLTMAWIFIYPACGVAINVWHTDQCQSRFVSEKRDVSRLCVLPDAFAPFFWRVLFVQNDKGILTVREQSLNVLGEPREPEVIFTAAPPGLMQKFMKTSLEWDVYFHFALMPVMQDLRPEDTPATYSADAAFKMFYDLRFGSGIKWVRDLLAMRPNADIPFLLMAEFIPPDHTVIDTTVAKNLSLMDLNRIRLRFSDSGRDSHWHEPHEPQKPTFLQWLVGLR